MGRNIEFYRRFIESCFARSASRSVPLNRIKREARLIFTSTEIETGLLPALRQMEEALELEITEPGNAVCLLKSSPVRMSC